MELQKLIEKAETTHKLTKEELTLLLSSSEAEEQLAAAADRVRKKYVGDAVHLRGLIEFSSYCRRNCMYCGLRRDNEKAGRYRLSPDEIKALAEKQWVTDTIQSFFSRERICGIRRSVLHRLYAS